MLATGLVFLLQLLLQATGTSAVAPVPAQAAGAARTPTTWDDFPVFVWREQYAGKPLPKELIAPFGGVILMREEDSTWARERGLAYLVWNVAGRNALHLDADEAWQQRVERWIETHDEKLLVREPCLNDPKTIETLHATLDATIAKHGEKPGLGFVLGDEVGLTPHGDPFDLCRCGPCAAEWRAYAREKGLAERAPLTDDVLLALRADDHSLLGAWLARARFEREELLELLSMLAQRIRVARRPVPIGLLGVNGANVFGGLDLCSGLTFVDFVEGYPVGDVREVLAALPERRQRTLHALPPPPRGSLATVFVGEGSPDGAAWKVWEHWLRGGTGVVLWSDRALAESPAHAARLAAAVDHIRRIGLAFPYLLPPDRGPVVLVHDDDSIALSWLEDALEDGTTWPRRRSGYQQEHGTREKGVRGWLRALEDAGAAPVSVPLSRLSELCRGAQTLVLAHVLVLGPADVAELERQLDLGATLVIDGRLGWVDRNGQPWKEDVLERLRRRAPERVKTSLVMSGPLDDPWPTFLGAAADVPWLIRSRLPHGYVDVVPDELLVTALPNPTTRALSPVRLEVQAPSRYRIEWIHPAAGGELPAGDAAVFLLRPVGPAPR